VWQKYSNIQNKGFKISEIIDESLNSDDSKLKLILTYYVSQVLKRISITVHFSIFQVTFEAEV
jgi:hypothetical protein